MFAPKFDCKLAAKSDDQKVARLLMSHCGCHYRKISDLSSKHREMMKGNKQYNPSHLSRCVPIINRRSSKGLRSSDGSKKSSTPETPLRRAIRSNNPLRRKIRPSDIFGLPNEVDKDSNPDLIASKRRELLDERPRHEKPRPSDAFLLKIPTELSSETEEDQSIDLRASRLPSFKPRPSDAAFLRGYEPSSDESTNELLRLRRMPSESSLKASRLPSFKPRPSDAAFLRVYEPSSDADDESTNELLRSRRMPSESPLRKAMPPSNGFSKKYLETAESIRNLLKIKRMPLECPLSLKNQLTSESSLPSENPSSSESPLRRNVRPSELRKPAILHLPTEDEELMCDIEISDMPLASIRDLTISGRFELRNGHLHLKGAHFSVPKKPCATHKTVAQRTITPDPTAKVIHYSQNKYVYYRDDCNCYFCDLLRQYGGSPLRFSAEFNTIEGHGFFKV